MRVSPYLAKKIHFVGIGGIGMSGIAEVLHNLGYIITGSDVTENVNTQRLRQLGVLVQIGHNEHVVLSAEVVVVSSAIKQDNPEVLKAKSLRIPVVQRAEMLAELMRLKLSVAVSGTHGKTTTTSLMASLFETANLSPTVVNGGIINAYGTNARLGEGEWIVVEADESDGSFVKLPATIAVVTNIDPEHMDFYSSFEELAQAFLRFVENIPFYGLAVLCWDHPQVQVLLSHLSDRRYVTYGFEEGANIRAINLKHQPYGILFDVDITTNCALAYRQLSGKKIEGLPRRVKDVFLPMVGAHNVQNALATIAVAQELGITDSVIQHAFRSFQGVKRRFTKTGMSGGVTIIDDYAHHPVEIKTVLTAAQQITSGRVIAVMQPHRYSRLFHLFDDFCSCFEHSDYLILAPVYGAGEEPIDERVTSAKLAQTIRKKDHREVWEIQNPEELAPLIYHLAQPGDMVVCLGAGSITRWASALPQELDRLAACSPVTQSSCREGALL